MLSQGRHISPRQRGQLLFHFVCRIQERLSGMLDPAAAAANPKHYQMIALFCIWGEHPIAPYDCAVYSQTMKLLLLYPEFPDTFWSFKHALKFIRKKASLPPLGLLTVAAMLPKEWAKRLVDVNVRKLRERIWPGRMSCSSAG
jgi:hypothetical protein